MVLNILDEIEKSRENGSKNIIMNEFSNSITDNNNRIPLSAQSFYSKAEDKRYLLEINLKNKK